MLDTHHRLRVMVGSRDCEIYSFSDTGYTIDELLQPGMFDKPASRAGIIPEYEKPVFIYVLAKDGPALFCSTGVDRDGKGHGKNLRFVALSRAEFEKEPELVMPAKRNRAAA